MISLLTAVFAVACKNAGVLKTRHFEEGRPVEKDSILFSIDPLEYEAGLLSAKARFAKAEASLKLAKEQVSVRAAEAAVAQTRAKLKKAEKDMARLEPLVARGAVPKQDLDAAEAAVEVAQADLDAAGADLVNSKLMEGVGILLAEAEVEAARAAVTQAELDLSYCTIRSPMDGLIGLSKVSVGNLVGRGESTVLATISTIDPMRATFTIAEQEYLRLRKGYGEERRTTPIRLTLANGMVYPHEGALAVGEREIDPRTGTLIIEATFANPDGLLRPGQFGRVRMVAEQITGAVVIPMKAVMEQQSAKVVYVVDDAGIAS
ncbi:MAG: efflux RND transporter periplasmic adaptor subunit, partial [Planctomycetes bacterium]|nr:efflux RND transporter periplasmic adaptor subunit [Planctomycetota bacterium]